MSPALRGLLLVAADVAMLTFWCCFGVHHFVARISYWIGIVALQMAMIRLSPFALPLHGVVMWELVVLVALLAMIPWLGGRFIAPVKQQRLTTTTLLLVMLCTGTALASLRMPTGAGWEEGGSFPPVSPWDVFNLWQSSTGLALACLSVVAFWWSTGRVISWRRTLSSAAVCAVVVVGYAIALRTPRMYSWTETSIYTYWLHRDSIVPSVGMLLSQFAIVSVAGFVLRCWGFRVRYVPSAGQRTLCYAVATVAAAIVGVALATARSAPPSYYNDPAWLDYEMVFGHSESNYGEAYIDDGARDDELRSIARAESIHYLRLYSVPDRPQAEQIGAIKHLQVVHLDLRGDRGEVNWENAALMRVTRIELSHATLTEADFAGISSIDALDELKLYQCRFDRAWLREFKKQNARVTVTDWSE